MPDLHLLYDKYKELNFKDFSVFHMSKSQPFRLSNDVFDELDFGKNLINNNIFFIREAWFKSLIYPFILALDNYLIYFVTKENPQPSISLAKLSFDYWANRSLFDGIINQTLLNIKRAKKRMNKVDRPNFEDVISNSLPLITIWLRDIGVKIDSLDTECEKLNSANDDFIYDHNGDIKLFNPLSVCVCKYCLKEFKLGETKQKTKDNEGKILIPPDHLHAYTSLKADKNSCKNRYKNSYRNPVSEEIYKAKYKLKIIYITLVEPSELQTHLKGRKERYDNNKTSKYYKYAISVVNRINGLEEKHKTPLLIRAHLIWDLQHLIDSISNKFAGWIVNTPTLYCRKHDLFFDKEKHIYSTQRKQTKADNLLSTILKTNRKGITNQHELNLIHVEKALNESPIEIEEKIEKFITRYFPSLPS